MLFVSSDLSKPRRIQGSFVTDEEISGVAGFIKRENPPSGATELDHKVESGLDNGTFESFLGDDVDDDMYEEALEVIKRAGKASASLLQRRLRVGYARAARLLDIMEERGVIGPADGAKPREIYIDTGAEEEDYRDEEPL